MHNAYSEIFEIFLGNRCMGGQDIEPKQWDMKSEMPDGVSGCDTKGRSSSILLNTKT
jgi:hypothetical protein